MSTLEFDLEVKKNQLDPALDSATKKSDSLQDALTTALGVFAGGAVLKGFDLLSDAIGNSIDFAKESVAAYSAQEDSLNKLRQAIRATGDESETSFQELANFSDELGRTTKQSGEAINQQLAYAKSLGATNQQSKNLVQAATELSATFGGSLESNVALLGKTLSGTSGKLGQMIPELKELTKEQLAAGQAAEIINSKFNGNAASELDSYSGRVFALGNAYDDVKKQIGGVIVEADLLKASQNFLTTVFKNATQAISDWRTEQERSNNGFIENEESVNQLGRAYEALTVTIENLEKKGKSLPGGLDSFDTSRLKIFRDELSALEKQINDAAVEAKVAQMKDALNKPTEESGGRGLSQEVLDSRKKLNDEILFLDQQLILEQNNLDLARDNAKIQNDEERNAAELQRMLDFAVTKTELEFQLKEQELARTTEGEEQRLGLLKLAGEKELALSKAKNDAIIKQANAVRDAEKKANNERIAQQQATASTITGIIGAAANLSSIITKESSKEQFFIQKAAALAQAIVATNLAMAMANTVPPPGNIPAIAAAKANGAIAISGIVASTIKGFAEGGIVGGEFKGASGGSDNRVITARDDEMFLNAEQQATVFNAIKSGNLGGGPIIIQIDGVEVFKAMRNVKNQGYKW